MRRVHRRLDDQQVLEKRSQLLEQLPSSDLPIGEVIRNMRISIKHSQAEYAALCGVAPRALADIEAGRGNPTLSTLRALVMPFACDVGVMKLSNDELLKRRAKFLANKKKSRDPSAQ